METELVAKVIGRSGQTTKETQEIVVAIKVIKDLVQDRTIKDLIRNRVFGDQNQEIDTKDSNPEHQQDKTAEDHREKDLEIEVMVKNL